MFNLQNKLCQKQFKQYTTITDKFSRCFETEELFDIQFKRWQRLLQKALHKNFRKIRIKDSDSKKPTKIDALMSQKNEILKKKHLNCKDQVLIDSIEKDIRKECEEREWKKIKRILGDLEDNATNTNIWKEMKKAFPKKVKPLPTGVRNKAHKVITNPNEKKSVILDHFEHRMRERPVKKLSGRYYKSKKKGV